jgi:hypothetical protein
MNIIFIIITNSKILIIYISITNHLNPTLKYKFDFFLIYIFFFNFTNIINYINYMRLVV